MMQKIKSLSFWLTSKGFVEEVDAISFLLKESARKPLPVDRAEIEDIVDELLGELGARMLAHGFSPLDVLSIVTGTVEVEESASSKLAVKTVRSKKDVAGRDITAIYMILFSDNPGFPPGQTGWDEENMEKTVVLGFNPNSALQERVSLYSRTNMGIIPETMGNINKELKFFTNAVRDYLVETLRHEEVHVKDVMKKPGRFGETYEVRNPDGESIEEIAGKLQVETRTLFTQNLEILIQDPSVNLSRSAIMDAVSGMLHGNVDIIEEVYNQTKSVKLKQGLKLYVPNRAASQIVSKDKETLKSIGRKNGVDPIRLLVINYNDIFPRIAGTGAASTYQHIYDTDMAFKNTLINYELPDDMEIKFVPSYNELYSYDRGFYLSTREEGKAHYEQIIFQLEEATRDMSNEEIAKLNFEDMIELSYLAKDYKEELKVRPVDKIIKTPIYGKTLERLKQERYKNFLTRMHYHWDTNIRGILEQSDD